MLILALSLLILGAILSVAGYSKKLDEQKEKFHRTRNDPISDLFVSWCDTHGDRSNPTGLTGWRCSLLIDHQTIDDSVRIHPFEDSPTFVLIIAAVNRWSTTHLPLASGYHQFQKLLTGSGIPHVLLVYSKQFWIGRKNWRCPRTIPQQ